MKYGIRPVLRADLLDVLLLAEQFGEEIGFNDLDSKKIGELVNSSVVGTGVRITCLTYGMEVVGILVGVVFTPFFSTQIMASEIAWYVAPAHRGRKESLKMLDQFEDWAVKQGAKKIVMVANEGSPTDPTRLYTRRGFKKSESAFVKEV